MKRYNHLKENQFVHSSGHYKILCRKCGKTIAQCRCSDPNKQIKYSICDKCKTGANEKI